MSFLGPQGVAERMAQIQSQLDALEPRAPRATQVARGDFRREIDAANANANGPVDPTIFGENPIKGPIGAKTELRTMAERAAVRHGLDPALFRALVGQESGWNPNATSSVGAKGLCQLMDGTAREMGVDDPYDAEQSLDGGARYLSRMLAVNHGDVTRALASYNAGFGRVNGRSPGEWPRETQRYVATILRHADGGAA